MQNNTSSPSYHQAFAGYRYSIQLELTAVHQHPLKLKENIQSRKKEYQNRMNYKRK
jgi:hypothetical protein